MQQEWTELKEATYLHRNISVNFSV